MSSALEGLGKEKSEIEPLTVSLTIPEIAAVVDALLQAELTLPLVDERHRNLNSIGHLRCLQLSLVDRLEDVLAGARPAEGALGHSFVEESRTG